jgi:hypothetical protein
MVTEINENGTIILKELKNGIVKAYHQNNTII